MICFCCIFGFICSFCLERHSHCLGIRAFSVFALFSVAHTWDLLCPFVLVSISSCNTFANIIPLWFLTDVRGYYIFSFYLRVNTRVEKYLTLLSRIYSFYIPSSIKHSFYTIYPVDACDRRSDYSYTRRCTIRTVVSNPNI